MPNLFSLIKPRGTKESANRNNFDLTNGHAYSQKAGIIDVVKCIDTVPKDYFDIDLSDATQSTAMNSAAFLKARKEMSAYYVPYNYVWSNYNQYQATREDPKSAALALKGIKFEPRIPLWVLYSTAAELWYGWFFAVYGVPRYEYAKALSGQHGTSESYEEFLNSSAATIERSREELFNVTLANNAPYYLFMRTEIMCDLLINEQKVNWHPAGFDIQNWDRLNTFYRDVCGNYTANYLVRKLDMLGYGNLNPLFDFCFQKFLGYIEKLDAYLESIHALPVADRPSDFVQDVFNIFTKPDGFIRFDDGSLIAFYYEFLYDVVTRLKLMCVSDSTGWDPTDWQDFQVDSESKMRMVDVYPLYAYNHVFYHMFRNSYFDLDYNVRNYNVDFLDCSTFSGSIVWWNAIDVRFWQLAHHQYKKDMFTGVLPDVQFGVVSSVDLTQVSLTNSTFPASNSAVQVRPNGQTFVVGTSGSQNTWNIPSAFDVIALKRAEMLQVYHQNLMRAGNRTSDIFKAIYGSDPKSELHSTPYFVEVLGEDMNLDPVIATANTGVGDNPNLGDIAARGLFSGSRSLKFSTEDFGCLLFLAYIVPEPFYNSTRIDPHRMNLTPEDHLIPELMNLGFSPVLQEWLCNLSCAGTELNAIRGYAPPYLEFKTDISLAHGAFASARFDAISGTRKYDVYGSLSHWVTTRLDMQSTKAVSLKQFYINPNVLDTIFKVANDDTYESDNFICRTALVVRSVRQFSQLGLPQF